LKVVAEEYLETPVVVWHFGFVKIQGVKVVLSKVGVAVGPFGSVFLMTELALARI
jgi:hypothetical protein